MVKIHTKILAHPDYTSAKNPPKKNILQLEEILPMMTNYISVRPSKHHRSHSAEKSCSTEIVCENMPR